MIAPTDLIGGLDRNLGFIRDQARGLAEADSLLQLPFRGNCLNWVLGHIASNRNQMLQYLGEQPVLSQAHAQRYGYNSEPVCGEGPDLLTLAELLAAIEEAGRRLTAMLQRMTAEDLARPVESFLGTTTAGQLLFYLFWHESYHTGQAEFLRQLAGKDDKVR